MNKSFLVQNSLMLAPLIGATGSLMTAAGFTLTFIMVTSVFALCMNALRPRLLPATHLLASVLLAATLTSCAELGAQLWSLQWHQDLGIYAGLVALQCVVLDCTGFFQRTWPARLRLYGLFGVLMVGLGLLRELIGRPMGTSPAHWEGWILTTDGGCACPWRIHSAGIADCPWQIWHRPHLKLNVFEETHCP
jgi:electron transport complex protein RnfE